MTEATVHEEQGNLDAAMEETIRGVLRAQEERGESVETVDPPPAPETEPPAEPAVSTPRDETGKFIKAKPEAKEPAAPAETPIPPSKEAIEPAAAAPETPEGIDLNRPPSSWKPAAKAQWAALPEAIRAEVYRREGDFHNGNKGIRENADFGQSIKGIVEPYRMLINAEGGTPEKAIADTLRTAALFRVGTPQQKLQALVAIDRQFNCGLQQYIAQHAGQVGVTTPQQQEHQPVYQDPRVDQLMANIQRQEQERSAQDERTRTAAADKFVASKTEKGEPLYPYVDNVIDDMSERIAILRRNNPSTSHEEILKQAYEAAVWANPETRAVLISQQQAKAQQPVDSQRKVETAKRASSVNVAKRGALPAQEPAKSLDDDIRETGRKLGMF